MTTRRAVRFPVLKFLGKRLTASQAPGVIWPAGPKGPGFWSGLSEQRRREGVLSSLPDCPCIIYSLFIYLFFIRICLKPPALARSRCLLVAPRSAVLATSLCILVRLYYALPLAPSICFTPCLPISRRGSHKRQIRCRFCKIRLPASFPAPASLFFVIFERIYFLFVLNCLLHKLVEMIVADEKVFHKVRPINILASSLFPYFLSPDRLLQVHTLPEDSEPR